MASMSEGKMKCFINMALKNTISWKALAILLDELTPTFDKSKQLNRILLKELESVQSKSQNQILDDDTLTETGDVNPESIQENLHSETKDTEDETFDSSENEADNSGHDPDPGNEEPIEKEFSKHDPLDFHCKQGFKYQCKFCHSSFSDSWKLKRHETIHSGVKPFKCKFCPKKFGHSTYLSEHEKTHTKKNYLECITCNKTFKDTMNLKIHNFSHTGEKPYKCKICTKRYSDPSSCRKHLKTAHC